MKQFGTDQSGSITRGAALLVLSMAAIGSLMTVTDGRSFGFGQPRILSMQVHTRSCNTGIIKTAFGYTGCEPGRMRINNDSVVFVKAR